jgi:hypothetical protein
MPSGLFITPPSATPSRTQQPPPTRRNSPTWSSSTSTACSPTTAAWRYTANTQPFSRTG